MIIIDKEDTYNYDENKDVWRHLGGLKNEDKSKIVVIATEPEMEEWICISLDLNFDNTGYDKKRKPSEVLKKEINYEKSNLHKYVEKLDFEKLMKKSKSFIEFCKSLS